MTELFESAIEAVRRLSPEMQDEIARAILHLAAAESEPEAIEPEHLGAVLEAMAQVARREFARDSDVEAAFRRFER